MKNISFDGIRPPAVAATERLIEERGAGGAFRYLVSVIAGVFVVFALLLLITLAGIMVGDPSVQHDSVFTPVLAFILSPLLGV